MNTKSTEVTEEEITALLRWIDQFSTKNLIWAIIDLIGIEKAKEFTQQLIKQFEEVDSEERTKCLTKSLLK